MDPTTILTVRSCGTKMETGIKKRKPLPCGGGSFFFFLAGKSDGEYLQIKDFARVGDIVSRLIVKTGTEILGMYDIQKSGKSWLF